MSRCRDRASAGGLLPLMEARPWKDGKTISYRYHPLGRKPVGLGTDKNAAIRKVLDMNGVGEGFGTLRWVWDRFTDAQSPSPKWAKLADGTRADYRLAWKQIDARLGHMQIASIDATTVARYVHVERAEAPRRANIEKSLLSRLFGHGIKLGVCQFNATIGVEPHDSEARTDAPDPALLNKFLAWVDQQSPQRRIIGLAAEYASLAGNRRIEFLPLTWWQVDRAAGEIRTVRAKQRGRKREQVIEVVAITPRLAALLDRLEAIHKAEWSHVFPTRDGNAYSDRGFKSLWQRCMQDAIREGVLPKSARFSFHDLRAYYATQHKAERGTLPDLHKNPETTARVYDRNKIVRRSAL
jgi:integrase